MDELKIRLTPTKIRNYGFTVVRRGGYDPDEVDSLLETVAEDYMIFADMLNHAYAETEKYEQKYRELRMGYDRLLISTEEKRKPETTQDDLLHRIEALERIVEQQRKEELNKIKKEKKEKEEKKEAAFEKAEEEKEKKNESDAENR